MDSSSVRFFASYFSANFWLMLRLGPPRLRLCDWERDSEPMPYSCSSCTSSSSSRRFILLLLLLLLHRSCSRYG